MKRARTMGVSFGPNPKRDLLYRASVGVIPKGRRISRGRGHGSQAAYPVAALPRLVEAERLRQQGVPYKDMKAMFAKGPGKSDEPAGNLKSIPSVRLSDLGAEAAQMLLGPDDVLVAKTRQVQAALSRLGDLGYQRVAVSKTIPRHKLDELFDGPFATAYSELRKAAGFGEPDTGSHCRPQRSPRNRPAKKKGGPK